MRSETTQQYGSTKCAIFAYSRNRGVEIPPEMEQGNRLLPRSSIIKIRGSTLPEMQDRRHPILRAQFCLSGNRFRSWERLHSILWKTPGIAVSGRDSGSRTDNHRHGYACVVANCLFPRISEHVFKLARFLNIGTISLSKHYANS